MYSFGVVWDGPLGRPHPISGSGAYDLRCCGFLGDRWRLRTLFSGEYIPLRCTRLGLCGMAH